MVAGNSWQEDKLKTHREMSPTDFEFPMEGDHSLPLFQGGWGPPTPRRSERGPIGLVGQIA